MVGRGRLLVVNDGEHHRRRLQKRNMAAPLHSHLSNDTLRFQDHLFSGTVQAFFCLLRFFPFFFLFFAFFFLERNCLLCAICDTRLRACEHSHVFGFHCYSHWPRCAKKSYTYLI